MNILPRLLFLFQALPVGVTNNQFTTWDKILSGFIWEGKRPRVRFSALQLPRGKGGMALPKLKEYYHAAQLRYVCCWCNPYYSGKWKDIECGILQEPIQNMIGDKELYETKKSNLDPITNHTLTTWFRILQIHQIQKSAKKLKWIAFDSRFKPAQYDQTYKYWTTKGMTAWCELEKNGQLESFQNLIKQYQLGKHDFFRYLQMRDYHKTEIQGGSSMGESGVIQTITKAYKDGNSKIITTLYKALTENDKNTTLKVKDNWEKELNIKINDNDWLNMCRHHHTTTGSRAWREFAWKNLIRYFITPKIKSKQLKMHQSCWRECGLIDVDHSHIFWKCPNIVGFWEMVCDVLCQVLGYTFPVTPELVYLYSFPEGVIHQGDEYLFKVMSLAAKKNNYQKLGHNIHALEGSVDINNK